MVRTPVVAGTFYPGDANRLRATLASMVSDGPRQKVIGLISPHAGYIYSGHCAGKGFGRIQVPDTVIILGVNHSGMGEPFAVDGHEYWATPLGDVPLSQALRQRLTEKSGIFAVDTVASSSEHSLEVQLPFIVYTNPESEILPITVSSMDLDHLLEAGREIAELMSGRTDILMVASTDMSHYINAESARAKDRQAIDCILDLDPEALYTTVRRERISMCGMAPTVMMLEAARRAGATRAEMIEYTHSGMTSGDYHQVVGYFSGIVY